MFDRRKNTSLEIFTEDDLKTRAANDDYWHNKSIDDAIYHIVAGAVYSVGILAAMGVIYFIYYYQFGPNKDPAVLIKAAAGILVYVSGIVTPTIKSTLANRRKKS